MESPFIDLEYEIVSLKQALRELIQAIENKESVLSVPGATVGQRMGAVNGLIFAKAKALKLL